MAGTLTTKKPQYAKSEIVDRIQMAVVCTESPEVLSTSRFQSTGTSRTIRCRILPPLIDAHNRSGNPGRFQLRVVSKNSFDVIPTASGDGPQTLLLDTVMSFDATDDVGAYPTLDKFCEELSRKTGHTVVFGGTGSPSENRLLRAHIQQHSINQPAREILRQLYKQVGSTDCWRLLYNPDSNQFWLRMRS
jgi:hypothetical protein